mmetsp:Transcript_86933/g.243633  ORF Transcript_86933/g.243633 Transcript_86933/m.243633 type:complete len:194 (+) Transcript_86933:179-760(+)
MSAPEQGGSLAPVAPNVQEEDAPMPDADARPDTEAAMADADVNPEASPDGALAGDLAAAEMAQAPGCPAARLPGPPAVTVQFMWGTQTFYRTGVLQSGRCVYKARGTLDGKGGLTLGYREAAAGEQCGRWELGSVSGGCLYRLKSDASTPSEFVGNLPWERSYGGTVHVTVMQSAQTTCGYVDPGLLAFDSLW